jgi:hypothetical protein
MQHASWWTVHAHTSCQENYKRFIKCRIKVLKLCNCSLYIVTELTRCMNISHVVGNEQPSNLHGYASQHTLGSSGPVAIGSMLAQ